MDSDYIVGYKIYKKDKEIYDICRISFFEGKYIETQNSNKFSLNSQELFMFNQIIDSPNIMRNVLDTINSEVSMLIFEDETHDVSNNDFEKLSRLWQPISLDQIKLI